MSGNVSPSMANWLADRGLEKYADVFERHEIDVGDLPELTEQHLAEMGLPMGARLKIAKAIRLDGLLLCLAPQAAPVPVQPALPASERRPVTVMFCDIVGSTRWASSLDPEDTRGLMMVFWRLLEQAAAQHNGHIAQHLGDGALVYFGYPTAQENDAERAVRAGLMLLEALPRLQSRDGVGLQVRIGIASGTVVLNEFGGKAGATETLAIGHAVNLAARLQTMAAPNSVVIDGQTQDLVGGLFRLEVPREVVVTGIDKPVLAFKVNGEQPVKSRFEARRQGAAGGFLGRSGELNLLLNRWEMALAGHGQLVLIAGEPGIGKSRLLSEAVARAVRPGHWLAQLQCSPHAASTPLQPVLEWLSQSADLAPGDGRDAIAAKLHAAFSAFGVMSNAGTPTDIAAIGDAAAGNRLAPHLHTLVDMLDRSLVLTAADPQQLRLKTLSAVVELFAAMATKQPLVLIAEDLHWCDPTTLEFFQRLLLRAQALPLLVLATARPEFRHDFGRATSRTDLTLPRLDRSHADALTRQVLGAHSISAQLLDVVAERADGVPLFVEELLRSLQETGAIVRSVGGVALSTTTARAAIPRSLDSILMARVDMLGANKLVAQMAACVGREFALSLLVQVAQMEAEPLGFCVAEIAESDLIEGVGSAPFLSYRFRHALVRDAAYNSLLLSERQGIHQRIAAILGDATEAAGPEIIAHHLTAAQMVLPAIQKWGEAGEAAKQRSADAEAIEHLRQALQLVEQLPPTPDRAQRELTVLLALVAPLRALKGFAAAEVAQLTSRALLLADAMKEARSILPLLYNNWVYTFVTAHRQRSEELARDILQRSDYDHTNLVRMTGLRAIAATQFTAGQFSAAALHFDQSITLYGLAAQDDLTHAVGLDGKVTALGYNSLTRWCLGETATAHHHSHAAVTHAGSINHISTTAFITYHQALLAGLLERNPQVLQTHGHRLETIGREHRFEMWTICGKFLQSLGQCMQQATHNNLSEAEGLFAEFEAMGVVYRPLYGTILADACLRNGDKTRGLGHVAAAQALMEKTGERWCAAEVYRLEGQLASNAQSAARSFDQALCLARAQGARAWEQRVLATVAASAA